MRHLCNIMLFLVFACLMVPAYSQQLQQKTGSPPHASATFDPAAIRRQAAEMADFRSLLSDPNPNVRLLTMREAIRTGDASQRQLAIETGLASSESSLVAMALRGVLINIQQIVIEYIDADGKPLDDGANHSLRLAVVEYNPETGQINGTSDCAYSPKWSGQLQGTVFTFNAVNNTCSANLLWKAETGDFRGSMFVAGGPSKGNPSGLWKPQ